MLHMETVAKTEVKVVSRSLTGTPSLEAVVFICNGLLVEQIDTLNTWVYSFIRQAVYSPLTHR